MTQKKINFAIVGYGHIGKRHAAIIKQHPDSTLTAVCDILPKEEVGPNIEVPFFNDLEQLLQSDISIDVVCICTPNYLHAPQSTLAINYNKHVVCEKPMGLTKAECESVIHAALDKNKKVFCVMQNRYSPPSKWIKEVVDQNLLGEIYFVHADCFWNRDKRYYYTNGEKHIWKGLKAKDGGTLFTQFSHFIDMIYWLFGDFKNINARFYNFNHSDLTEFEDSGSIQFDFINGGAGSINYSTSVWDQNFESSLTIIGAQGTVKIGGQYMNEVTYCNIKDYDMPKLPEASPPNDYGTYKGSAANHHYVIQNVVDVLTLKESVSTNALEGLKVVEILERIYKTKN